MAKDTLKGLNVAILVTDGFEQVELTEPRKALDEAGATTKIVSPKRQRVRAWNFTDWSIQLPVDVGLDQAQLQLISGFAGDISWRMSAPACERVLRGAGRLFGVGFDGRRDMAIPAGPPCSQAHATTSSPRS
jgi:putative intracellular protease/amidase